MNVNPKTVVAVAALNNGPSIGIVCYAALRGGGGSKDKGSWRERGDDSPSNFRGAVRGHSLPLHNLDPRPVIIKHISQTESADLLFAIHPQWMSGLLNVLLVERVENGSLHL